MGFFSAIGKIAKVGFDVASGNWAGAIKDGASLIKGSGKALDPSSPEAKIYQAGQAAVEKYFGGTNSSSKAPTTDAAAQQTEASKTKYLVNALKDKDVNLDSVQRFFKDFSSNNQAQAIVAALKDGKISDDKIKILLDQLPEGGRTALKGLLSQGDNKKAADRFVGIISQNQPKA